MESVGSTTIVSRLVDVAVFRQAPGTTTGDSKEGGGASVLIPTEDISAASTIVPDQHLTKDHFDGNTISFAYVDVNYLL